MKISKPKTSFTDIILTLIILSLTALLCLLLYSYYRNETSSTYTSLLFLLAVFIISRYTNGYFCGIMSSLASVFFINYCFTYPYFEFNMFLPGYPIVIISTSAVAIITSAMTTKLIEQKELKSIASQEKMRGNLLRAISHDLRTPLTTILGAVSGIRENDEKLTAKERKELLTDVEDDVKWLIAIVENLLTITKMNDDLKKITKCNEIAEEIVLEAVNKVKKRHPDAPVFVTIPDEILFVPMDPLLIEQVLINIIENSIRHGEIVTRIDVELEKCGNMAKFTVTDNGIGFDNIDTVFAQCCQKKENSDTTKNMGIGLCVCKSIIKAHCGEISAKNVYGYGAEVSFVLPLENGDERKTHKRIEENE